MITKPAIVIVALAAFASSAPAWAQTSDTISHDAVGDGPLARETSNNQSQLGVGRTGAVPNDGGINASGAMNGNAAINDSPVAGTGNLGSGSTSSGSDPMNGVNNLNGPAVPTGSLSNTSH